MKKISDFIKVLLVAVVLCVTLAGCGGDEEIPEEAVGSSLVIIAGNHANAKAISSAVFEKHQDIIEESYKLIKEDNNTYSALAQIKVMVADGNPEFETSLGEFKTEKLTGSKTVDNRKYNIEKNNEALLEYLTAGNLMAEEEEVDLTKALREASIYLNSIGEGEKYILILDTLLPTTGAIDFTQLDFQEFSASELLETVKKYNSSSLPDLEGIKVIVDGALDVCDGQTDRIRDKGPSSTILDFWKGFFGDSLVGDIKVSADGGKDQLYIEDENDNEIGYPYVTPIAVVPPVNTEVIVFKGSELRFVGNSDEFVDESKSIKYIRDTAGKTLNKILMEDPDRTIYVVGSIARIKDSDKQTTSQYSEMRAEKVADILVRENGIPRSNIKIIDAGVLEFSWRNADEFEEPNNEAKISELRAKNRTVAIICGGENCSEYKEVMEALAKGAKEVK